MRAIQILMVAIVLTALGCGGDRASNNSPAECTADSDCTNAKVCRASLCTVAETSPRMLGFRLSPPPSSTYPSQSVAIRELPADEPVQIGLDPGVRVAGALSYVGEESGPNEGRLKFRRHGDDFTAESAVVTREYELYVPAGTYQVTFFPADTKRPTRVWDGVRIELDTDPRLQMVRETVEIVGTLSRTDLVSRESAVVASARVFATSRQSGITSSVTTTGTTGSFTIHVPPDSGAFDLHVAPMEPNSYEQDENGANYIPDARFDGAFRVEGEEWINLVDENPNAGVLAISLGEYGYAPLSIPVQLRLEGEDVADWSGTTVTLRTEAGRGSISVRHRLGPRGEFALPLVMGLYDAIVRTPPSLPARSMEISNLEIDPQGIILTLTPLANVTGEVRGPSGDPLEGAELRFVPVDSGSLTQQVSVKTEPDGRYQVWLEDAPYLLTVLPSDPGLPRYVGVVQGADVPASIRIDEPVLVWGTVFGTPAQADSDDWEALPNVSVQVVESDENGVHRVVGENQTNERGDFRVVIGARP